MWLSKLLWRSLLVLVFETKFGLSQQTRQTPIVVGEDASGDSGVAERLGEPRHDARSDDFSKCSIYLAPSTIPNAGLGIFTTIPRQKGDFIGHGDVFLPLFEMDSHNYLVNNHPSDPSLYFNPFLDYLWTGDSMGLEFEVRSTDVHVMGAGLDAAINCNLALINVGRALPAWDDGGLHRSRDPGSGALTLYHNGTTSVVHRNIPAGGELFKFYGNSWFETRPDWFGELPLSEDYVQAQRLLDEFGRLTGIAKYSRQNDSYPFRFTVEMQRELWKLVSDFPIPSRTLNALPKRLEDAWVAIVDELAALYQPYAIRSEAFLEEHGKCFDHIKPGRSAIKQAGRGAFVTRPLKEGAIISGTPLLHLPHYNTFHMYDLYKNETTGSWQRGDTLIGHQLKLNYCFGHTQSTILLCPYGAGVSYINHNQSLANVKVQWSKHGLTNHNDSWFNLTPPQMEWIYETNLALDFVALRDIDEGEELFMDYGAEFETAWQTHVGNWKPLPDAKRYVAAHDFNMRMSDTPLRTEREQELDPYPHNLQTRCHSILSDHNWRQYIPKYRPNSSSWWPLNQQSFSCRILHRVYEEHVDLYKVHVFQQSGEEGEETIEEYTRSGVPRHAIAFSDRPYTTDMHLRNAFRFPILIPDEMLPNAWRNAARHNFTN